MLKINAKKALEFANTQEALRVRTELNYFPVTLGDPSYRSSTAICLAYMFLLTGDCYERPSYKTTLENIDDDNIRKFVASIVNEKLFEKVLQNKNLEADRDALVGSIFINVPDSYDFSSTPSSLTDLAVSVLDIKKTLEYNDPSSLSIADICCGTSNFLVKAASVNEYAKYSGCDINADAYGISLIRASLLEEDIDVELTDAFNMIDGKKNYDFIFMNHPFGLRINQLKNGEFLFEHFSEQIENISRSTSCDWMFALLGIENLSKNGKMAVIVTNSCLYNGLDSKVRQHMVNNGLIEAIIELPSNMFPNTGTATSLILFSHGNNDGIRFINASKTCEKGRRQNYFSEEDIKTIVNSLNEDSDMSVFADIEKIANEGYQLNSLRYMHANEESFENGILFETVIKNVFRGAPLNARELDELSSNEETDFQYLMLSNIKDGIIDSELPYLTRIDGKYEKYCIKDRALLVSKNGAPFKTAVAEIPEGKKVLANGNLYVFELDEEKANPYYVQAFLSSDAGQKLLSRFVVGVSIPNLPLQDFKKAIIPLPDLDTQNRVADEYASAVDEINVLKMKLERAKRKLKESFDKGREG